jgi:hypothetical protein
MSKSNRRIEMKVLYLALLIPLSASASPLCDSLSTIAGTIMTGRQNGQTMQAQMNLVEPTGMNYVEGLVVRAYSEPRYETDSVKKNAINDFKDQVYLECTKAEQ